LFDQSKRPNNCPNTLSEEVIIKIIQIRHHHPTWGAKKIARIIADKKNPDTPSVSSVYRILDKANLLKRKKFHKSKSLHKENLHQLIEPSLTNDV